MNLQIKMILRASIHTHTDNDQLRQQNIQIYHTLKLSFKNPF
jgi:hypothetical protein